MNDESPERDPAVVRRELRIQRAVTGAVLHGYQRDNFGFTRAVDALFDEDAALHEVIPVLWWALSRLPRGMGEPEALTDQLIALYPVEDG